MKLPNAEQARVDPKKLKEYLLSEAHPIGRSKARFFRGIGFDESNMTILEQGMLGIAKKEEVAWSEDSLHGTKYIIDGCIMTPHGSRVKLRTVWIIDKDRDHPRFVTAYPV